MGVPMADCGLCPGRIAGCAQGRVKSGLARRVEGGLPETGEFGAIFDRGGGVSGILIYTAKIRKKVETSKS